MVDWLVDLMVDHSVVQMVDYSVAMSGVQSAAGWVGHLVGQKAVQLVDLRVHYWAG